MKNLGGNMDFCGFESKPAMPGDGFGLLVDPPPPQPAAGGAGGAGGGGGGLNPNMALGVAGGLLGLYMMSDASRHNADAAKDAAIGTANALADARRTESQNRADAQTHESDNRLDASKDANQTMRFSIMTNSRDFMMQVMAMSTVATETLDTKERIAFKDADIRIAQINSNERIEERKDKVEERALDVRAIEARRPETAGTGGILT